MGFYDEIGKGVNWELTSNTQAYLKVVNGKLLLPNPGWLQYHLRFLDNVIEALNAFRAGQLKGISYDVSKINKIVAETPEEAKNLLRLINAKYNEYGIDIETSNLLTDRTKNRMLCIGVAYKDDEGISFLRSCFDDEFKKMFAEFAADKKNTFIFHNGIFDKSRTKIIEDLDLKIDEDTLLMHYCGINEHKGTHGLKDLAQLYLGFPEWEKVLDDWKRQYCRKYKIKLKDFQYDYFPQRTLAEYNVIDCCATFQLKKVFAKLMRKISLPIYRKLVEASEYYADMISRGMLLDLDYLKKLENDFESQSEALENDFEQLMPGVSVTSPKQLLAWLRKTYPYDNIDTTGATEIENLSYKYPDDIALKKILEYRKVQKYLKTYVYGLRDRMDSDCVIHCEFKLHGTETGRLSSANPNMQNIPRNSLIKKLFIARPGYEYLQLDYSQSELRVLAYISQDEKLMQCYIDGRDLHTEMQKHLFGDKYDPENKDQRVIAKTINFGIPYGRTAGGMARKLGLSMQEAKQYLDNWFKGAPRVKDYIKKCHEDALAEPQRVYYTPFGRARFYFVTSENVYHVANQSVNFPISSTANDLTIYSLCQIGKWLKDNHFDAYMINTVHDSIVIEVRPSDAKVITEYCQKTMAEIPQKYLKDCKMPFRADAELGPSYGDLKEPDFGDDTEDETDE